MLIIIMLYIAKYTAAHTNTQKTHMSVYTCGIAIPHPHCTNINGPHSVGDDSAYVQCNVQSGEKH